METLSDWAGMDGHIPPKKKMLRRAVRDRMMKEQQNKEHAEP